MNNKRWKGMKLIPNSTSWLQQLTLSRRHFYPPGQLAGEKHTGDEGG